MTSPTFPRAPRLLAICLCCAALGFTGASALAKTAKSGAKTSASAGFDMDAFNNASDSPLLKTGSKGPAVVRAQILLDRAWFSCGEIDGRYAANMQRMVKAYQTARSLKVTGTVTPETWKALREDSAPLLATYTVTDKDLAGPFEKTPADMAERAKMKAMVFESVDEALAEKFHTSIAYLKQLNGGRKIEAGKDIVVPNVSSATAPAKATSIEIDKSERVLYVLDAEKRPVAAFPISIGNEKNDPLPIGMLAIKNEVKNPSFTYDPKLLKNAPKDAKKIDIAPGPNNPVGSIWLGLTKPHWGIHGTSKPSNVGHSETNGCIHLTNWDAERLSTLAKAGFKVDIKL
ncbi:L,D-transpeptidase [Polaromonas sp.]|uniref:L,D-transpeptidase family protein n=1 Tax=Polaromonas sp. TaxID=1869339 RepID=UPI0025F3125F|nr:L,D-transpeptidase [Polaromonas sp.]